MLLVWLQMQRCRKAWPPLRQCIWLRCVEAAHIRIKNSGAVCDSRELINLLVAAAHLLPKACRAEHPPKAEDLPPCTCCRKLASADDMHCRGPAAEGLLLPKTCNCRGPAAEDLPPRTCCRQGLLQLRAGGYEGLACGVGGELGEVLDEALCKIFCLLVPLACRGVGVSWVQNLWIYAME